MRLLGVWREGDFVFFLYLKVGALLICKVFPVWLGMNLDSSIKRQKSDHLTFFSFFSFFFFEIKIFSTFLYFILKIKSTAVFSRK